MLAECIISGGSSYSTKPLKITMEKKTPELYFHYFFSSVRIVQSILGCLTSQSYKLVVLKVIINTLMVTWRTNSMLMHT